MKLLTGVARESAWVDSTAAPLCVTRFVINVPAVLPAAPVLGGMVNWSSNTSSLKAWTAIR